MTCTLPAAVLWDMDGTLVDSEPYWIAEEHALVESFGGRWSHELAMSVVGLALLDSAGFILAHSPVRLTPEQVVDRLVAGVGRRIETDGVPWRPGAQALLAELKTAGVPTALVTMSYRALTDRLEAALPPGSFDVVVSGEQVERGKPDPLPYLVAAARLGVPPSACVAIEDSDNGVRSATRAAVPTVCVPHVKPVGPIPGAVQVATLAGLRAGDLVGLTAGLLER